MTVVIESLIPRLEAGVVTIVAAAEDNVGALVRACSPGSLRQRFFLPCDPRPEDVLSRYRRYLLATPPRDRSVVAVAAGVPVGLLNLVVVRDGLVEAGLLVADAWQRRRIGTRLFHAELIRRRWAGWTVRAMVRPDNLGMHAFLRRQRLGRCRLVSQDRDQFEYEIVRSAPA